MISGKTSVCGLIGNPVEHSMSPGMQNIAFEALGLDFVYVPFRVEEETLVSALQGMRALGIRGLNVTIPHKVTVIPLLDRLDKLAANIGAVNTIVNDDGILTGYNSDAAGFMSSLAEHNVEATGKRVLIIGAGGAARAAAFTLVENNARPVLINRSVDKAREIARIIEDKLGKRIDFFSLDGTNLQREIEHSDMVVNTTSVGMHPDSSASIVPAHLLRKNLIVYDIVYNPRQTRLIREAVATGAIVIGGTDMLAWQGAIAFEIWTGRKAPIDLMKKEIVRQLEQYEK